MHQSNCTVFSAENNASGDDNTEEAKVGLARSSSEDLTKYTQCSSICHQILAGIVDVYLLNVFAFYCRSYHGRVIKKIIG